MEPNEALRRLGYSKEWIEWGILSEVQLASQYKEYLVSDDQHAEHYRHRGFADYLASKVSLTDREIDLVFRLKDAGTDNLCGSRIIHLMKSGLLTDEQLESLAVHPEVLEIPIKEVYDRVRLIRSLEHMDADAGFERLTEVADSWVHRRFLDLPNIKRAHVEWLSQNGCSRSIRNLAKQLLRSKRFRGERT
jgi:hypothetical protein